jgi:hypothetical protein
VSAPASEYISLNFWLLLLLLPLLLLQPTASRQFLIVVNHPKHPTLCVRIRQFVRGLLDGRPAVLVRNP